MNLILRREDLSKFINKNSVVCEIGVKNGEFFEHLVKNKPKMSYAIDVWDLYVLPSQNDLNYNICDIKNFEREFRNKFIDTQIFKMSSIEASKLFSNEFFDLIYIDADHTYDAVKNDLYAWYPKLKSGGILSGHDYCDYYIKTTNTIFGVVAAVDEFVKENDLLDNFQITKFGSPEDRWKSWIIFKP